ncbi:hypothetical protein GCK32_021859, partial [Trichostrongylus colubriformis]
ELKLPWSVRASPLRRNKTRNRTLNGSSRNNNNNKEMNGSE